MKYQLSESGKTFEVFQWTGDRDCLPDWGEQFESEDNQFYGHILRVDPYLVRPTSWVLKSDDRGDIFPVKDDMFHNTYDPVEEV